MQLFLCELMVQTFSQPTLFFKSFMPDILIFLPPYHGRDMAQRLSNPSNKFQILLSTGGAKHDVRPVRFVMDNILKLSVLFPLDGNKHERQLNLKSLLYG